MRHWQLLAETQTVRPYLNGLVVNNQPRINVCQRLLGQMNSSIVPVPLSKPIQSLTSWFADSYLVHFLVFDVIQ